MQGDATSWRVTQSNITVAQAGTGNLTVADGAVVTIENGTLKIGSTSTGVGHVKITGAGSQISSQGTTGTDYMAVGIAGQGTLEVNDGASVEAHTTILGFDSMGKGTLTLDGAGTEARSNNYTMVGYLGKAVATVSNGATLRDDGASGIRIAFAAGSTGVLNIGAAADQAATGAGNIVANGGIAFGDGAGTLVLNHTDNNYVLAPGITGTGNIDVLAGRTTLQGDSSGFNGQTSIQGGQVLLTGKLGGSMQIGANGLLQVGDGVTNGDLTADTVNDGTLIFDQAGNYDYTGALSGSGGLVKRGDGTLTLSGDYQYKGTTTVQGGIVSLAAQLDPNTDLLIDGGTFDLAGKTQTVAGLAGNSGELALGATGNLTVNQNQDSRFGGILSGAGTFNKAGTASLNLTRVSSFNGLVNVDSGRLLVNGELPATIIVHDKSVLGGSGTAGAVIVRQGGTMAPGNSIGTLRVNGNVQFDAGSIYEVEVDAAGNGDRIEATGSAQINGGTVQVLAEAGNYSPATRYLILEATGGVTGRFENAVSNFAFLNPSLAYDANTVRLALIRNDTSFAQVAQTLNQRATAGALESAFAAGSPVNQALVTSTAEQARQAFDALSGEVHASTLSVMAQQSEALRRTALNRLDVDAKGPQLWVQATGGLSHLSSNGNSASVRVRNAGGLSLGVDTDLGPARVGVAASYATSDVKVDDRHSSADTEALSASVYAGMRVGAVAVRAGASYSDLDVKTSRNATLGALSEHLSAKYGGKATTLFGEVGYPLQLAGGDVIEPFAGMNALWLKNDAFDENGGSLALHGEGRSRGYSWSTLGVKGNFALGKDRPVMINATVGWQHALSSRNVESRLAFAQGGPAYTIQGAPLAKDAALLGLDVDWQLSPATQIGIGYSGSLTNQGSSHAAHAVLRTRF